MAINSLSLVNQKLAYVRTLLRMASTTAVAANLAEVKQQQALLDSAVFQLICGYHHYLREIADNYRIKNLTAIFNESSLLEELSRVDKVPSEASEISLLRQQQDSWLAQLHSYYDSLWLPPMQGQKVVRSSPGEFIQVVDLGVADAIPNSVTLQIVAEWESAFNALVARQRETASEY